MAANQETLRATKESGITTGETRVIVLTGAGENFCAARDLKQYSSTWIRKSLTLWDD